MRASTRIAFFVAGFCIGAWAPLVPFAQERSRLDDAALGSLLLCFGTGSILTMPVVGTLAGRFGCRGVIMIALASACSVLPLLATASAPLILAVGLLAFGAAVGAADVAINLHAVAVERAGGRAMMSGFHGCYSIGSVSGAGIMSMMLWLGFGPLGAALSASSGMLLLSASAATGLQGRSVLQGAARPLLVRPIGRVLLMAGICFVAALAEGSMLDWSALFLSTVRGVPQASAGLGYAIFASAMSAGRLSGDALIGLLGPRRILALGGLLASAGYLVAVAVPGPVASMAGFFMVGIGLANVVPVLTTAAGSQSMMPVAQAVSTVVIVCYAGMLIGPAAIGPIAHASSLPAAFLLLSALTLCIAAGAWVVAGQRTVDARKAEECS